MIDSKRWAAKKFIRDNAVAAVTSGLLILVLLLLVASRFIALNSIRDLSKINPLITSGQNELVAVDDNGAVKIIKDDEQTTGQSGKTAGESGGSTTDKPGTQTGRSSSTDGTGGTGSSNSGGGTGSTGGNTGGSSGGGSSSGGSSGGSGGGTTTPPAVFAASVGQITYTTKLVTSIAGTCTINYNFQANITAQNAPGTVTYRWNQSNGVTSVTQQPLTFQAGDTSKTTPPYTWTISGGSASYTITLELLTPASQQQSLRFQHTC